MVSVGRTLLSDAVDVDLDFAVDVALDVNSSQQPAPAFSSQTCCSTLTDLSRFQGQAKPVGQEMIKVTPNPYYYQRQLPHYQKQHCILFVTFCKLLPDPFSDAARSLVLRYCLHDNGKKLRMHAAVVMPERVHLLLTPLPDPEGRVYLLLHILKLIKGTSARSGTISRATPVQFGRRNRSITSCGRMKASKTSWNIFGKIQCEDDWCNGQKTIRGCGLPRVGRTLLSDAFDSILEPAKSTPTTKATDKSVRPTPTYPRSNACF